MDIRTTERKDKVFDCWISQEKLFKILRSWEEPRKIFKNLSRDEKVFLEEADFVEENFDSENDDEENYEPYLYLKIRRTQED